MRSKWFVSGLAILALSLMVVSPLPASHQMSGVSAQEAPVDPHAGHGQMAAPTPPTAPGHGAHQVTSPTESGSTPAAGCDMAAMQRQHAAAKGRIDEMRGSMTAIKASINPDERRQLMRAHLAVMTDTLAMLTGTGCGAMMQAGRCPMMAGMQHGQPQGQGGGMHHGSGSMAMSHGGMDGGQMGQCHLKMQVRIELITGLMEQIIELQGQMLTDSGR